MMKRSKTMEDYFNIAFKLSLRSIRLGEVPVGAVLVHNGKIISKSFNCRQRKHNVLGHAEISCIIDAQKKIKDWRLNECILYVTLEPCNLCKNIITESRINHVYYLAENKNTKFSISNETKIDDYPELSDKYKKMLRNFFRRIR